MCSSGYDGFINSLFLDDYLDEKSDEILRVFFHGLYKILLFFLFLIK